MREDVLHFIWKTNKLHNQELQTTKGERLVVHHPGVHNHSSGPDFFNAQIEIDGQLWAGNVEVHLKSSDWYAHGHETDANYNNVILHLVWEDDVSIFRKDNTEIPTLLLKDYVPEKLLDNYKSLFENNKKSFVNCVADFAAVDNFTLKNWYERLYIERLEQKSELIFGLLKESKNDWEKVLFLLLLKTFGLNTNGAVFLEIARALDFAIVRKLQSNVFQLESVLMGLAGQLDNNHSDDTYLCELQKEYGYLKAKFGFNGAGISKPEFFGLRPSNFPMIRLSQLASLYNENQNLFAQLLQINDVKNIYNLFEVSATSYWDNHYTFGKESRKRKKKLTKNFIDLLLINTIIPIKFCHAKHYGSDIDEELLNFASALKPEKNKIIQGFDTIGTKTENAFESQSKIQLYNEYCTKNRCLHCAVGAAILNRKD